MLRHWKDHRKVISVDRNSTLSEFLSIASEAFGLGRNTYGVYLQRYDESWGEWVDVDSLQQIQNRDKLFLSDGLLTQ